MKCKKTAQLLLEGNSFSFLMVFIYNELEYANESKMSLVSSTLSKAILLKIGCIDFIKEFNMFENKDL